MAGISTIRDSETSEEINTKQKQREEAHSTDSEQEVDYFDELDGDYKVEEVLFGDFCRAGKKPKNIQTRHNYLKFRKQEIWIKRDHEGKFYIESELKYSSRQVQQLVIGCYNDAMDNQLLKFMRTNFRKNINSIRFHNSWTKTFADGLKFLLRDVEIVDFDIYRDYWSRCGFTTVHLNEILQQSPRVKCVSVRYYDNIGIDYSHVKCPNLKTFECFIKGSAVNDLTDFFQQNRTIKRVIFRIRNLRKSMEMEPMKWLLNTIILTQPSIKELFIEFTKHCEEIDFELIKDELKRLDTSENFKRFELKGGNVSIMANIGVLASLKSFKGLHLSWHRFYDTDEKMLSLNTFVNLELINFDRSVSEEFAVNLSKKLLNLKEVFWTGQIYCENKQSKPAFVPFVYHSPNLRRIISTHCSAEEINVSELNAERKKLKGAKKLAIYVNAAQEGNRIVKCVSGLHDLVTVEQIKLNYSVDADYSSPLYGFEHPLEAIYLQ